MWAPGTTVLHSPSLGPGPPFCAAPSTLDTLEKLASAVGADLVVRVGTNLSANRSIAKLERDGHAVVRRAS